MQGRGNVTKGVAVHRAPVTVHYGHGRARPGGDTATSAGPGDARPAYPHRLRRPAPRADPSVTRIRVPAVEERVLNAFAVTIAATRSGPRRRLGWLTECVRSPPRGSPVDGYPSIGLGGCTSHRVAPEAPLTAQVNRESAPSAAAPDGYVK
jgi:hypothetical protein